jgi:cell division protein FtsB
MREPYSSRKAPGNVGGFVAEKLATPSRACERCGVMTRESNLSKPSRRVLLVERGLPIGLLALAICSVPVLVLSREGLPRLRTVSTELGSVERENLEIRREIEALRARVKTLRDDPAAVERLARDDLGMVRQSEVVFQFSE